MPDDDPQLKRCGCPATDGVIRHQRGTCTDPAVAGLDWYADRGGTGMDEEPQDVTLVLHIQLNGQRWTLVADEIIADIAERLGVTITGSRLSRGGNGDG